MLILTTIRRLALPLLFFLAWTPPAYAWSWPVQGAVLQPFTYDEAHPYASGQHRGIDIGADTAGETVVAPTAGTISFAGSVPTSGKSVTIETADGYAVTLTHLGSIGIGEGARVAEQDAIGTIGPSGTPELEGPYLHLGIRVADDPNGYVDPLGLLPAPAADGAGDSGTAVPQPTSSGTTSTAPVSRPAPAAPTSTPVTAPEPTPAPAERSGHSAEEHQRAQDSRSEARPKTSPHRSVVRAGEAKDARASRPARPPRHHASEPVLGHARRPVVEPMGLGTGHEIRPSVPVARPRRRPPSPLTSLACNWAAALFALGAAFAAERRRRRSNARPAGGAKVLRLPPPAVGHRHASRAA